MALTTIAPYRDIYSFKKFSDALIKDLNQISNSLSSSSSGLSIEELDMKPISIKNTSFRELSSSPQNDFEENFKPFFQYIAKFLQSLYRQIKNEWDEIFPEIFDIFIKYILKLSFDQNQPPIASFEELFQIAEIFGLKNVPYKTINRLAAGLQYNIIDSNWISEKNLVELKEFNRIINKKYKIAYKNFEILWKISKVENEFNKKMNQDLNQIVSI